MSRHRGAKHRRRYELLGGISLLSPEYLLSVERWPFHSEPPDHYDLLSHLLAPSRSQSSWLMPFCATSDVRRGLANLRAPPLLFRRRPPQSNYPPDTVRNPDYGSTLEHQTLKGGISRSAPCRLASTLQSLPPILHIRLNVQCQAIVKVRVFPSLPPGCTASSQQFEFQGLRWGDSGHRPPFVRVGTYPTRNFATLGPL